MGQNEIPTAVGSLRQDDIDTDGPRPSPPAVPPTRGASMSDLPTSNDVPTMVRRVAEANASRHAPLGFLASGGMGTIDLVHDRTLDRRSVMKRIHPHLAEDARSVRMFVREAQVTGQLEHPNIVPVHVLDVAEDGALYFTMKLVEGRTLEAVLREIPPGVRDHALLLELLDIVVKVCDALAFAHSKHIVHCDVKPANIMVGDFGQVYLMDWGVARASPRAFLGRSELTTLPGQTVAGQTIPAPPSTDGERLESGNGAVVSPSQSAEGSAVRGDQGYLVGTPTHMSPEQALAQNDTLDERSDVFAVGAVIYHALTGRPPYEADTFWTAVALAQDRDFPSIESIVGEGVVARALIRIVDRAMAANPVDRYQSVAELSQELLRFVRGGDSFPALSFPAGEYIVREGDRGAAAYIIQTGQCEATQGEGESRRVLRRMGPGEVFGEMAILAPGPRTASVVTTEPTTVHVVDAEVLERELDALKPWFGAFVRTLAARFREREKVR